MIKQTTCLSDSDWENLHGNEVYVTMLRHKVKLEIPKKEESVFDNYDVTDYIKEVPEYLVYYQTENVYGHITMYVYFESPIDMQNFTHFYNTDIGLKKIKDEK